MKKLVCEVCGGHELQKQGDIFVCQSCGCQYTDASKLLIEIDKTKEVDNLYKLARRERDEKNYEDAAKHYEMILTEDPSSWEATFYRVCLRALTCKIINIDSAANSITNCLGSVFKMVKENVDNASVTAVVAEIEEYCYYSSKVFELSARDHFLEWKDDTLRDCKNALEYVSRGEAAYSIMFACGDNIEDVFEGNENVTDTFIDAWEKGIEILDNVWYYSNNSLYNYKDKIKSQLGYKSGYYSGKASRYSPEYEKKIKEEKLNYDISLLEQNLNMKKEGVALWKVFKFLSLFDIIIPLGFVGEIGIKICIMIILGLLFISFCMYLLEKRAKKKYDEINEEIEDKKKKKKNL